MVKCGVLKDCALFGAMADGSWRTDFEKWIARCVEIKRAFVDLDPFDKGERQFLNLGHTFGHAVEACSGFSISHGQGVAIGLAMAFRAARLPDQEIVGALEACGLPAECPYSADELFHAATLDKKRRGERITLVLPEEIGKCVLKTVPVDELLAYIQRGRGESA
jgi:3-dehydroquinate synthase